VGEFWKPYIGQAQGGKLDLMVLNVGVEEWASIQWEKSMLRKRGDKRRYEHVVRKGGDERSFGDHVLWKMISSDYVERRGGDSLNTRFEEEVIEK
jgi:hypothetical protein